VSLCSGSAVERGEKCLYLFFGKADEDDAVLACVREEDISEGRCDLHCEKAILIDRPCSMLA